MSRLATAEVREVGLKDLPSLSSIPGVERGWGIASLTKEFLTPSTVFGVVDVDGSPIGYAVLQLSGEEGYLSNIVIHPIFRGLGLGRDLLDWMIEEGVKRGMDRLVLEVREGNSVAIALYRSKGFKEIGKRPRMYSDGEDALVMEFKVTDL
jgi:ribosomal-protein-alanine N-acetyltransferase